ncbi:hypothetical protein MUY27_02990 [Mucilaginibacter sp. RS28]|uniref:Uncharacterized protein n=1 Tax=Mucilaginibacter straminoryzae TaxID=2932774 RepID=A0A9X1WZU2_9SPHI|nr:hypothetical protein [Mucilaginibacter straminoryzae]MCJ8208657.1 hypothetical protein [Mucilaginibacter straminoryzae]
MTQVYLINQETIRRFEDISPNIKPERLLSHIKKAQDLDFKMLLGRPFFNSFISQFNPDGTIKDNAPEGYRNLLNGNEYLDLNGNIVLYEGIAPALVYFTLARIIETDAVRFSSTGLVSKTHDTSVSLSSTDISKLTGRYRSIANAYANEIEKFLNDHRDDFQLWQYDLKNKNARQPAARIRGIDRTSFNLSTDLTDPLIINPLWQ